MHSLQLKPVTAIHLSFHQVLIAAGWPRAVQNAISLTFLCRTDVGNQTPDLLIWSHPLYHVLPQVYDQTNAAHYKSDDYFSFMMSRDGIALYSYIYMQIMPHISHVQAHHISMECKFH